MKKFLLWSVVVLVIALGVFTYWKYFYTYGEGYRAGLLQKFSYKGTIFKTYEGELILSSIKSNQDVSLASEKFFFSVEDNEVAKRILHLEGFMVVVHYREKNGALFWQGDTKYIVDSVKVQK